MFDEDIKIAGSKPSLSVRHSAETDAVSAELDSAKRSGDLEKAHILGKFFANKLLTQDADVILGMEDHEDVANRVNLLAFTATVGFEQCRNSVVAAAAYGAFYEEIKQRDRRLYDTLSDAGVFSFYYLAYRRGNEVERRMGQTYAMLCGMDGDPVHQELGEALYCHFTALVRAKVEELGLQK